MSHKPTPHDASKLDPNMRLAETDAAALTWHDPACLPFQLVGFPWYAQDRAFRRLPLRPPEPIPAPVDALANCAAGGQVRFQTDSPRVAVRVTLLGPAGMVHMPATGECGCDLYVNVAGQPRYYGTTKYDLRQTSYEIVMFEHARRAMRAFTLYLPLYKGIRDMQIGLSPEAITTVPPPYADGGRIVVYGTSITQGGCASRPGMAYTNILGRLLNRELVNLGFSGNGRGEPAVARLVADVPDPRLFIIDYDPNCPSVEHIEQTLPELLRILRARHAAVPILVMSRIAYGHDLTQETQLAERLRRRDVQARIVAGQQAQGDRKLHFLDGATLLGEDFEECTVDQVHPTDLGFYRIAKGLEPVVRGILG